MPGKREKVRVTHIEMKVGVGEGWPRTYAAWALCRPDEVRIQKNLPEGMTVEVYDHGMVSKSSLLYKRAKMTSDKGGRIDWSDSGWYLGAAAHLEYEDGTPVIEGAPAIVYIPENLVGLVNDD